MQQHFKSISFTWISLKFAKRLKSLT